jgi:dihydrolipoamide dehydrogenase
MYDLIVIGAGPGGYEAAAHAAHMGKRVALVEKGRSGGTCLNVGCIPTKTLLKSARVFAECKGAARYGVHVGDVAFDMAAVIERKNRIVGTLTRGVDGMLQRAGVETIAGHGHIAARDRVDVDGRTLETRNVLIATGSRPATPPIPGLGSEMVLDSTAILNRAEVPGRMVIIGGGYIGLEFASFYSAIGTAVTVIEMLPHVAAGTDRDIAARLARELEKSGVKILTSCRVTAIENGAVQYTTAAGAAGTIATDLVLNATGRVPVVEDLGLEPAGIDFTARGIRTSDEGRTSVPGIWACGDVTGRRLLAHAATREGIVAVNNMFGKPDRLHYAAIPSVIYTHPEVASVGYTEEELKAQGSAYLKASVPMTIAGRFLVENEGASGLVKVLAGARYREILGVHIAGDGASEFIVMAAGMIENEMCAEDLERVVFPHPTVSEALKAAVQQLKPASAASAA